MPRISKQTANRNVKINTDEVPSQPDHLVKLATSFAAGYPPDIFVIDYCRYGLLQNAGVIEPVEPSLDKNTVIKATDFYTKDPSGNKLIKPKEMR